jgi:hypothetical protein
MSNFDPVYTFSGGNSSLSAAVSGLPNALQTFYTDETDFSGLPDYLKPASGKSVNLLAAAISLLQWVDINQQGYSGPGLTPEDPFLVPVDQTNRQDLIENLGQDARIPKLLTNYDDKTRFNPAIRHVFYNFAEDGLGGIRWDKEENELVYFDRYNFEGYGDFGLSPTAEVRSMHWSLQILYLWGSGAIGSAIGSIVTPTVLARSMMVDQGFNPATGEFADGTPISDYGAPFTLWKRGDQQISNMRNMFIELRIPAEEICEHNPALYRDAVSKGFLELNSEAAGTCSEISAQAECYTGTTLQIPVGNAQPMPLLGFPYYPPNVSQMYAMSTYNFGVSNKYPSPFTSYIQQTYNTANHLGAYAMWGPIAGRLILLQSGPYTGEYGFIAQCWDVFDDGPNNRDADNIQYPSKLEWWNTCEYEIKTVRNLLFDGEPPTPVKVAIKSFNGPGDDDVWRPSWQPSASPFGTVALGALVGLAALTGRFLR